MNVTDDELQLSERLRSRLEKEGDMTDEDWEFCSGETLTRYGRARSHHEEKAYAMLRETIAWRRAAEPQKMICKTCVQDGASHSMRGVGVDRLGRPVFYSQFAGIRNRVPDDNIEHLIFKLEHVFKSEHVTNESFVWVIDFAGFSRKDLSPAIARRSVKLFQDHYPERLGRAVLLDAPVIFEALWKLVKPFVDPNTLKKVDFIRLGEMEGRFTELFSQDLKRRIMKEVDDSRDKAALARKEWWKETADPHLGTHHGLNI